MCITKASVQVRAQTCWVCCCCARVPMCSGLASHTQVGPHCALQPLQLCFWSLECLFTYQHIPPVMAVVRKSQQVRMWRARGGAAILQRGRDANSGSLAVEEHGAARGSCSRAGRLCHGCSSSISTCCCHGPWRVCWPESRMMSYAGDPTSML